MVPPPLPPPLRRDQETVLATDALQPRCAGRPRELSGAALPQAAAAVASIYLAYDKDH